MTFIGRGPTPRLSTPTAPRPSEIIYGTGVDALIFTERYVINIPLLRWHLRLSVCDTLVL